MSETNMPRVKHLHAIICEESLQKGLLVAINKSGQNIDRQPRRFI